MSAHGGMGGGGPRRGGPGGLRGGPPGMRAANPEDNVSRDAKGALLRLARLLRPAWLRVLTVVVLTLVVTIANVITPKLLGDATNVIVDGIESNGVNFTRLAHILLIVAVLYIGANVIQFLSGILLRYIVQQMGYELRRDAQAKIDRLPLDFIDKKARGDLLSRVTNDVDNITSTLQATLSRIIDSIYTFIGVVIMMFYLSWSLSLISLLILPVGVVVTAFVIKRAQPHFTAQWENTGKVSTIVEESFTGLDVVSAYGLGEDFAEAYDESNDKLFESSYKAQILSQLSMPIMTLASNLSFVAIAVIGGLKVISGTMTIGGIQAFIQYSRQLSQPIQTLSSMASMLQSGAASGERVFDFLDSPEMVKEAAATYEELVPEGERHGTIVFDHVRFSYEEGKPVIRDLSLRVERGQSVAIVGPTGAGKTTLVNLLMRFYEIDSGHIYLDGVDIRDISKASLRARMGMVLQDTWLFEGTIWDNLAFGREDEATKSEIVQAAYVTGADRLIRQLPEGYDTVLNEEGGGISAGEKQLLTITRAYLSNSDILILDEATSSVDTRTEMLVQQALGSLAKDRTSFIIAHRLSTIRDADMIIVMEQGDVVETGTHDELLKAGGAYARLYNSQFTSAL